MAKKEQLRSLRKGTIINKKSSKMESQLTLAVENCIKYIDDNYSVQTKHVNQIYLSEITSELSKSDPSIEFFYHNQTSFLKPDGGILFIKATDEKLYPILISEAKRQGTNDDRSKEGLKKQAKGNAIERLGKNVIGFRALCSQESIFPFVVFGEGVDFEAGSSILDRVSVIALFSRLNSINVLNEGLNGIFQRGSFFFRVKKWTAEEMTPILIEIATTSIEHYMAKYSDSSFTFSK